MSAITKVLEAKRREILARAEGADPDEADQAAAQTALSEIQERARVRAQKSRHAARKVRKAVGSQQLKISEHAWTRLRQRGLSVKQIYAIWIYGERSQSKDPRSTLHRVTDKALREAPAEVHPDLVRGAALVVSKGHPPVLVTVIADGADTEVA